MSLNDPHWGRSSDEEKKNDRGDNEQRSDGVGEDGEEQNARQNPNAQDDRNPADSSADGSRRTSRDAREDDEQRDRRSQGLLSDDDLENLWSNFQQAANKIMGRQGRSNQEDLRSRLKSRDDFSRDDEPNDAAPRQKGDDYPDDGGTHGGQKRQGLFAELDRLRNQFEEDDQRQQQRRRSLRGRPRRTRRRLFSFRARGLCRYWLERKRLLHRPRRSDGRRHHIRRLQQVDHAWHQLAFAGSDSGCRAR